MPAPRNIAWLVAALVPAALRAEGLTGFVEGDYLHSRSVTTDTTGTTRTDSDQFSQRYRLIFDRSLFPLLRFNLGGGFEQIDLLSDAAPPLDRQRSQATDLFANVFVGSPLFGGAAGYLWRIQSSGAPGSAPDSLYFADPSATFTWRPEGLPSLQLRFERPSIRDRDRLSEDLVTNIFNGVVQYRPTRYLDLRYSASYFNPIDDLRHSESILITQALQALWAQQLTDRVSASLNGTLTNRHQKVVASASAATIGTQVFPLAGLSLIEPFPPNPAQDKLDPNALLIDNATGASANVNIGFGPTQSGDANFRDLGVQFADAVTTVNTFYLWVDKRLPPAIAQTYSFAVWRSDDNANWVQVPLSTATPPIFSDLFNRFEITFNDTQARYLKVVVAPLNRLVTADPTFQDIFVTELQAYKVVSATRGGWAASTQATGSGTLRILLGGGFAYDGSAVISHSDSGLDAYNVVNGLTFGRKVGEIVSFDARAARQDQRQTQGHQGIFLYSASLAVNELPTLGHSLVYSGQRGSGGAQAIDSISFYNRATPYRGIGLLAGGSLTYGGTINGQTVRSDVINCSATFQPHPSFTLTSGFAHTASKPIEGVGVTSRNNRAEATATFSPVPAFFLSGGVARVIADTQAFTLANASVSVSPFREGALQFSANASQSLDPGNHVTKVISSSIRWNIHRGMVLTGVASRAQLDTESTLTSYEVNLRIPL